MAFKKIRYLSSPSQRAGDIASILRNRFGILEFDSSKNSIDLALVLGGDGFMLSSVKNLFHLGLPIYGINCGNFGFLLNDFNADSLLDDIASALPFMLGFLDITISFACGSKHCYSALNDLYIIRDGVKTVDLSISVNGEMVLEKLVGDGIVIATPAGSSAYNFSAGGTALPIGCEMLAISPINPFYPKGMRGTVLCNKSVIHIEVKDYKKRPANAVADLHELSNIKSVTVSYNPQKKVKLLFKAKNTLTKKMLIYQFFQ